jgi:hypothetical protein
VRFSVSIARTFSASQCFDLTRQLFRRPQTLQVARLRDDQREDDLDRPDHLARDRDVVGRSILSNWGP